MDSTGKVQIMDSPWHIPLPMEESAMSRVTVYFYNDGWVPIKYCYLGKAILLYHQARSAGKEIFLFPVNLDPNSF